MSIYSAKVRQRRGCMIPEEKNVGVIRAMRETFGKTEFRDIRPMSRGLRSDLLFRIVVDQSPYLLRLMTQINGMVHWKQLVRKMRQRRSDEALRIVSEAPTNTEGVSRL